MDKYHSILIYMSTGNIIINIIAWEWIKINQIEIVLNLLIQDITSIPLGIVYVCILLTIFFLKLYIFFQISKTEDVKMISRQNDSKSKVKMKCSSGLKLVSRDGAFNLIKICLEQKNFIYSISNIYY